MENPRGLDGGDPRSPTSEEPLRDAELNLLLLACRRGGPPDPRPPDPRPPLRAPREGGELEKSAPERDPGRGAVVLEDSLPRLPKSPKKLDVKRPSGPGPVARGSRSRPPVRRGSGPRPAGGTHRRLGSDAESGNTTGLLPDKLGHFFDRIPLWLVLRVRR